MKTIDAIKHAMDLADLFATNKLKELEDAPLTRPTENGGCHPMWIVGHLAYFEGEGRTIMFGEPNPLAHWKAIFGTGSEPSDDAALYPPFDEVVVAYSRLHAENAKRIAGMSDADLDRKSANPPKGAEPVFDTVGKAMLTLALHAASHRGQLADARRARRLQPAFG